MSATTTSAGVLARLEDEERRLQQRVRTLTRELAAEPDGSDDADRGAAALGRDRARRDLTTACERLEQVHKAVRRANAGTYGICVSCGGNVSDQRLEVLPATDRCVHCS